MTTTLKSHRCRAKSFSVRWRGNRLNRKVKKTMKTILTTLNSSLRGRTLWRMELRTTCFKTIKSKVKERSSKCSKRRKRMSHSRKGSRNKMGVKDLGIRILTSNDGTGRERLIDRSKDLRLI